VRVLKCASLYLNPQGNPASPFQWPSPRLLGPHHHHHHFSVPFSDLSFVDQVAGLPFPPSFLIDVSRLVEQEYAADVFQGDT